MDKYETLLFKDGATVLAGELIEVLQNVDPEAQIWIYPEGITPLEDALRVEKINDFIILISGK